jgi:phosphate-selective porin OprO/OprP
MNAAMSAVLALGMCGAAYGNDEAVAAPRRELAPEEIEALLNLAERVGRLEAAGQDSELDKLKKAAEKEKQEEMNGLPARVSKLEKQADATKPTWDSSKMLSFASPDGNFTAKIGGRIYFVYRHIFERNDNPANAGGAPDQFILDSARFQFDGTFFKDFYYRVEGEAAKNGGSGNDFQVKDTYIGWTMVKDVLSIQGGQMKVPWSQEETTSSRFIDFAERSLLNRLSPSHDQGIMAFGSAAEGIFQWWLGGFNGSGRNTADTNDEKDLAGRLFVTPFKTVGGLAKDLRFGFDFTVGDVDNGNVAGITDGDLGGITVNPLAGAAGVADGLRTRLNASFSWIFSSFSLRGEYAIVKQELVDTAAESDFEIKSWYVQGTYLLTGEAKPLENRVKPNQNLSPFNGGWGAWELAARICVLDTSDAEDAGFVASTANQKTTQITAGINWWWAPNVALRIDWEHLKFDEDLPNIKSGDKAEDSQDIFYVRWQIDF